jgi:hypothetical protein
MAPLNILLYNLQADDKLWDMRLASLLIQYGKRNNNEKPDK